MNVFLILGGMYAAIHYFIPESSGEGPIREREAHSGNRGRQRHHHGPDLSRQLPEQRSDGSKQRLTGKSAGTPAPERKAGKASAERVESEPVIEPDNTPDTAPDPAEATAEEIPPVQTPESPAKE